MMIETYLQFVVGYLAIWIIFFGAFGILHSRLKKLEKRIDHITQDQ